MTTDMNQQWVKEFQATVDQRGTRMPTAWVSNRPRKRVPGEGFDHGIFISGNERTTASAVIDMLSSAMEIAIVSSFLLADDGVEDAIFNAAQRGVRVYLLLASEVRLDRDEPEGEFEKGALKQHKLMLTRLGGHVLVRTAAHFHAKVVITDPEDKPAGMLFTCNLTKEALERNQEIAVTLNAAEVIEMAGILKWAMWESAEHEMLDESNFNATMPLGVVQHPEDSNLIVATTAQANTLRTEVLRLINCARSSIQVSSFGWDKDHEVIKRLCDRAREGVRVTVLTRTREVSMPALLQLAEAGAYVFAYKWLHAKAIWTDADQALVMSANLQKHGLDESFELGVCLRDDRAQTIRELLTAWELAAPWRLHLKPELGGLLGCVKFWPNSKFTDIEVEAEMDLELGKLTAESADNLEDNTMPAIPTDARNPFLHPAHLIKCTWQVIAPSLAPNSKAVKKPSKDKEELKSKAAKKTNKGKNEPVPYALPVFREPNGRVVIAVNLPDQLPLAQSLMSEVGATAIVVNEKKN